MKFNSENDCMPSIIQRYNPNQRLYGQKIPTNRFYSDFLGIFKEFSWNFRFCNLMVDRKISISFFVQET